MHFYNDFFGHLFPHADEVECIYNAYFFWDISPTLSQKD